MRGGIITIVQREHSRGNAPETSFARANSKEEKDMTKKILALVLALSLIHI